MRNTKLSTLLSALWLLITSAPLFPQVTFHPKLLENNYFCLHGVFNHDSWTYFSASKEEIELYCKACRILLTYLITRLQAQTWHPQSDSHSSSTLTIKQLLLPIKAFCTATSQLQRTEQFALVALMKNAKLPQHIKTSMPSMKCDPC